VTFGGEDEGQGGAAAYSPSAAEVSAAVRILARRTTKSQEPVINVIKDDLGGTSGGNDQGGTRAPIMIPSGPGLTCKLLYDRRSKYSEPNRTITVRSL
jgi:hypothetical protein